MPNILFQITEEDIRSLAEREGICFSEEDMSEIIEAVSDMDTEDIILDIFTQYSSAQIRKDIVQCMGCDKRGGCQLGQYILTHGPKLAGLKPITISGRN